MLHTYKYFSVQAVYILHSVREHIILQGGLYSVLRS